MGYKIAPHLTLEIGPCTICVQQVPDSLVATNISVIVEVEQTSVELPLFLRKWAADNHVNFWTDVYFPTVLSPLDLMVYERDVVLGGDNEFCPLESFLYAFWEKAGSTKRVGGFLATLGDEIKFKGEEVDFEVAKVELAPKLATNGYLLSSAMSHERELSVILSRRLRPSDADSPIVKIADLLFRPTHQKKLNNGRWWEWERFCIPRIFWNDFKQLNFSSPRSLLTSKGEESLLAFYKWTRLSLMSNAEARQARVSFIRERMDLIDSLDELAEALQIDELYSSNTSISQIKRGLPKLIHDARRL